MLWLTGCKVTKNAQNRQMLYNKSLTIRFRGLVFEGALDGGLDEDVEAMVDARAVGERVDRCIGFAAAELRLKACFPIGQTLRVLTFQHSKTRCLLEDRDVTLFLAFGRVLLVVTGIADAVGLVGTDSNDSAVGVFVVLLTQDGTTLFHFVEPPRHRGDRVDVFYCCHIIG